VRSRVSNLGDDKNPELRRRVITGEISPNEIAKMTTMVSVLIVGLCTSYYVTSCCRKWQVMT
jgi:hypothetical protein